jgi:hypothetical protein
MYIFNDDEVLVILATEFSRMQRTSAHRIDCCHDSLSNVSISNDHRVADVARFILSADVVKPAEPRTHCHPGSANHFGCPTNLRVVDLET